MPDDLTAVAWAGPMARFLRWDVVPHPEGRFVVLSVREGDAMRLLRFEPGEARRLAAALGDMLETIDR